ncbi:hypothetical protein ACIKTA_07855 [Hansschlegelia beijingensis]|uniref:hypothetical protein n=1 Tax=Hansschlegelia beijingensis TaxID=1133344 RepID=UPI0037F3544E
MVDRKMSPSAMSHDASSQLSELRATVSDLAERVGELSAERARAARNRARSMARSVSDSASTVYDEGMDALHSAGDSALYYGRRAGTAVRNNPGMSLLGLAVGVGVIAAICYAMQEDDRRWYERRRGGWF